MKNLKIDSLIKALRKKAIGNLITEGHSEAEVNDQLNMHLEE